MAKIRKEIGGDNFTRVKDVTRCPEGGANSTSRQSHTS